MSKMTYQDADRIRKKSFISGLTEKLVEGESIGSSIKKTISEKSAARAKGFKEKIDPMNIIRFMTGGSKLAAAMYGSMRGRTKQDMQYFTDTKPKPVGDTATKIGQLEGDNESAQLLLKIYELMRASGEDEKLRKEKENNRKEELEYERSLRHKDLIEALTGLAKPGTTATATKEKDDGGFGGLFAGLIGFIKGLIDTAIKSVMDVVNGISDFISKISGFFGGKTALEILFKLGRFFTGPIGLAILAAFAAKTFVEFLKEVREKDKVERPKDYEFVPADVAKQTGETMGEVGQRQKGQAVKQVTPQYAKELLSAKPAFTDAELVQETGLTRTELEEELKKNPRKNIMVPIAPKVTSTTKKQLDTPLPPPEPVATPPASNELNEKTKEMNDVNLPKPVMAPKSETINTTNVMADKKIAPTGPLPSVRNQEPTFKNLILYSTRVV
jgi:hypothetical protein